MGTGQQGLMTSWGDLEEGVREEEGGIEGRQSSLAMDELSLQNQSQARD